MAQNTKKRNETKKKLQDALMLLYKQYDFQKITVTMICQESGLHRSTFYLYYNSVDEILREIENDILMRIPRYSKRRTLQNQDFETIFKRAEPVMIDFYEWQYSMRDYLNSLLGEYGDPYFIQHYEQIIQDDLKPALEAAGCDTEKHPYILKYVTGGVLKTNKDWLLHGDISVKDLVALQRAMIFNNPLVSRS